MIKLNKEEIVLLLEALDFFFNQEDGEDNETNKAIMALEIKLTNHYENIEQRTKDSTSEIS